MSQINAPQNGPNLNPMEGAQPAQPQAGRAARGGEVQGQRINDIVNQVELLPYQQRRAERSTGQQVAYVLARVVGAVLTLGVSEGVIAIGHRAERANAEAQRQAALERRAADAHFNMQLGESLMRNEPLAPQYQAAVQEAIAQLREDFGDLVPENANDLNGLPHAFDVKDAVSAAIRSAQGAVSPEALRGLITQKAAPALARKGAELALDQAFQNLNFEANTSVRYTSLVAKYPDLKAELEACRNRSSVDNVLGAWKERIEGYATYFKTMADGKKAALEYAIQRLADKFEVSVEVMGRALDTKKLASSFDYLKFEIGTPEAEIRQAYMDKAESFLQTKFALLDSVDEFNIPDDLKTFWKNDVLTIATLDNGDTLRKAVEAAFKVSQHKVDGIEALFSNGMPDADTVYAALMSLSVELHEAEVDVYGFDGFRELGGDGQGEARFHTSKALLTRMPNLQATLEQSPDLVSQLHDRAGEDLRANDEVRHYGGAQVDFLLIAIQTKNVDNAQLATSLGDLAQMPVPFLAALNHAEAAVRANFADMGLLADLLSFNPGEEASVRFILRQAVSKATEPLTPEQFSELAQRTMNTAAANAVVIVRVHELEAGGQPLQRLQDSWIASTLALRHPELNEVFAAGDMATVRAALGELDGELTALVRLQQDMNFAWTAGEDYIYRRMEEATGVGQQELRETLNLSGVTYGGSFSYTQGDRLAMVKNPDTSVLAFPGREELVSELEGIAERFVSRKGALYQTVDDLGLPPAAAAELKAGILKDNSVKMPDFLTRCSDLSKFIAAEPMRELLSRPASKESVLDMIQQMTEQYDAAVSVFFPPKNLSELGPDGARNVLKYTLQIFFARNPSLEGVFQKEFADALSEAQNQEIIRLQERMGDPRLSDEESNAVRDQFVKIAMASAFLPFMTSQV